jgi:hypothetical protein
MNGRLTTINDAVLVAINPWSDYSLDRLEAVDHEDGRWTKRIEILMRECYAVAVRASSVQELADFAHERALEVEPELDSEAIQRIRNHFAALGR